MIEIRATSIDEVQQMTPLAARFWGEGNLPGIFNADSFERNWTNWIEAGNGIVFCAWDEQRLVGGIGGLVSSGVATGSLEVNEMFWFVDAGCRQSGVGPQLLDAFESAAREVGAERYSMVRLCDQIGEKLDALLKSRGFRPTEVVYYKEL